MRVKVDRDADFAAESLHQFECRIRFAKSRQILNRQEVRAQFVQLLSNRDVILERIFWAAFVENVAGVANGSFTDGAGFERGIDRDAHVFDGIKRIENAKDVDALGMCFADEFSDETVRIGSVADSVGAAEEHLETDVWNALAQVAQALPGIFVQEAHRRVKRRSAPHLEAEKIGQAMRDGVGGGKEIKGANARSHQGLMGVAKSCVGDEQAFFFSRPGGKFGRTKLFQELACADGRFARRRGRDYGRFDFFGNFLPFYFGIAVEDYIAEIGEQFGGAIAAAGKAEKFRRLVEERRGDFASAELRVIDNVFHKGNVRFHAADAEFAEGAVHPLASFGKVRTPRRHFDEQRIVIRGERRSGISSAAIEANAKARRRTVGGKFPVVGGEVVLRVFRGHAAL